MYQMWRIKVIQSRNISIPTKMHTFHNLVMSILLLGAETWAVSDPARYPEAESNAMPEGHPGSKPLEHAFKHKCAFT